MSINVPSVSISNSVPIDNKLNSVSETSDVTSSSSSSIELNSIRESSNQIGPHRISIQVKVEDGSNNLESVESNQLSDTYTQNGSCGHSGNMCIYKCNITTSGRTRYVSNNLESTKCSNLNSNKRKTNIKLIDDNINHFLAVTRDRILYPPPFSNNFSSNCQHLNYQSFNENNGNQDLISYF